MRAVLAVSATQGWKLPALDSKQAYLNAKLPEDVRLEFTDGEVVKARKAVFGLR